MANQVTILVVAASSVRRTLLVEVAGKTCKRAGVFSSSGFSLERVEQTRADVLVADLDTAASAAHMLQFMNEVPAGVGAVALADNPQRNWVAAALNAGVNAIISREADPEELRLAVEAADQGLVLLHPTSARNLAAGQLSSFQSSDEVEHLTAREREVLLLISDGLGNKEIAARLGISENTVKFHTSSNLGKLGAVSRTEAVSQGIRRGVIAI